MARVAFIGLGNMGGGMAANLVKAGHEVAAFDLSEDALLRAEAHGAARAGSAPRGGRERRGGDHHAARRQACPRGLSKAA